MESNPNPMNPTNPQQNGQSGPVSGQQQPYAARQAPYDQPQAGAYGQPSDTANPYAQPAGQYDLTNPAGQSQYEAGRPGSYASGQNPYQQQYQPNGQQPQGAQGHASVDFEQLKVQAKTQAVNLSRQATSLSEQMESRKLTVSGHTFSYVTLITFAGALLTVVASALPFASLKTPFLGEQSVSLFQGGDGWLFLVLAVVAAVFAFRKKTLPVLIASGAAIVLTFYELIHFSRQLADFGDYSDYGIKASLGIGAILLIVGVLAMGAGALASFLIERKARRNGSGLASVPFAYQGRPAGPAQSFGQQPFAQTQPQQAASGQPVPVQYPAQPAQQSMTSAPAADGMAPAGSSETNNAGRSATESA